MDDATACNEFETRFATEEQYGNLRSSIQETVNVISFEKEAFSFLSFRTLNRGCWIQVKDIRFRSSVHIAVVCSPACLFEDDVRKFRRAFLRSLNQRIPGAILGVSEELNFIG